MRNAIINISMSEMKTTKKYWKGLAQLNNDPIVEKLAQNEFIGGYCPDEVCRTIVKLFSNGHVLEPLCGRGAQDTSRLCLKMTYLRLAQRKYSVWLCVAPEESVPDSPASPRR